MEKNNKEDFVCGTILMFLIASIMALICLSCTPQKPNGEVVLVDEELMTSHHWDTAYFDIDCVDSLQQEGNYYWFIYDDPDAFEQVLCVSTNKETYDELQTLLKFKKLGAYDNDSISLEQKTERFHLYYGQCEETVLLFE